MDWLSLLILVCIAVILLIADWLFIRYYLSDLEKSKNRIGFNIVIVITFQLLFLGIMFLCSAICTLSSSCR